MQKQNKSTLSEPSAKRQRRVTFNDAVQVCLYNIEPEYVEQAIFLWQGNCCEILDDLPEPTAGLVVISDIPERLQSQVEGFAWLALYLGVGLGCDAPIIEAFYWAMLEIVQFSPPCSPSYSPTSPSYMPMSPTEMPELTEELITLMAAEAEKDRLRTLAYSWRPLEQ
jgi:hypothetical protein